VSEACLDLAVQIKGSMDETVDPCENFYNFTCGNWDVFNHIPQDLYGTGALGEVQGKVYTDLADTLESDFTGGNSVLEEMSDLYASCIAVQLINETEFVEKLVPVIRGLYQELGGWSLVGIPGYLGGWSVNSEQFIREKRIGSTAFYGLDLGLDEDALQFILVISQAGLTLEDPEMYYDQNATDMLASEIALFLNELAQEQVVTETDQRVTNIVQFEMDLAEIWEEDELSYDDENSTYTIQELSQLWPEHNWLNVLGRVFSPSGVTLQQSSVVTVATPEYFMRLSSLVQSTSTETLENYAKWTMTWQLADIFLADDTIQESLVRFRQTVMGKPSLAQRQKCVSVVDDVLSFALGRVYAEYILPPGYKVHVSYRGSNTDHPCNT
jgi:predicted metalloendopeptidase